MIIKPMKVKYFKETFEFFKNGNPTGVEVPVLVRQDHPNPRVQMFKKAFDMLHFNDKYKKYDDVRRVKRPDEYYDSIPTPKGKLDWTGFKDKKEVD